MDIKLANITQIDELWPYVSKHVADALERGNSSDLSVAGLYKFCRSGQGFLFISEDLSASLILGFETDLKGEFARIVTFSSEKSEDWGIVIKSITDFAKANGVNRLLFNGRKGWERSVKDVNFVQCEYEMDI